MKTKKSAPTHKEGKRNPAKLAMTEAGRSRKHRQIRAEAEAVLRRSLGYPRDPEDPSSPLPTPQLIEMASAWCSTVGQGNHQVDFEFAVSQYLSGLRWCKGSTLAVDGLWDQFIRLVREADRELARRLVPYYLPLFVGCVMGHTQRLCGEYDRTPDAITDVEIFRKDGKDVFAAVRRDGTRVRLPGSRFVRENPWFCFAGIETFKPRPPAGVSRGIVIAADFPVPIVVDPALDPANAESLVPTQNLLFNVAVPESWDRVQAVFKATLGRRSVRRLQV